MALISEVGGEAAIIRIASGKSISSNNGLVLGIGDDAALIEPSLGELMAVTTDMLVEGVHFCADIITPYYLGWKSLAVNVSDIAAMGGKPTFSLISIGLPDIDIEFIERFYQGLEDCAEEFGTQIIGGDTVRSDKLIVNITQLGLVHRDFAAKRSGAVLGDAICVTGSLGDSAAGLQMLLTMGLEKSLSQDSFLVLRHLKPTPRVETAKKLAASGILHSMMDISDGLAIDLERMLLACGVGARIFQNSLPVSDNLLRNAPLLRKSACDFAMSGGEDYELLFTCSVEDFEKAAEIALSTGVKVSRIGEVARESAISLYAEDGSIVAYEKGWQHY